MKTKLLHAQAWWKLANTRDAMGQNAFTFFKRKAGGSVCSSRDE